VDVALGLLRDVDLQQATMTMFTPLRDLSNVRTVCVGSVRWPTQGEELGRTG
jgi:polynucleotide 5'-kinase involved in rRNA processing